MARKKEKTPTPWTYAGTPIEECVFSKPFNPFGFVYLITNTKTGQKYIGRKYMKTNRKKTVACVRKGKKVKGKKKTKREIKESDWMFYKGSSKQLLEDISKLGLKSFKFEIISFHNTKGQTNYSETKALFVCDVLNSKLPNGNPAYYNDCIMNRYHRGKCG